MAPAKRPTHPSPSRCREWALQCLYQADLTGDWRENELQRDWQHFQSQDQLPPYLAQLLKGIAQHQEELDALISRYSEHWRLDRMSVVDRNLLRLATYELLFQPEVPAKVVINEAVQLAKRFGAEDSGAFVNGLLDRIRLAVGRNL